MIYYWPGGDHPLPSGGVKTHYRHVEILNELGIPASVLHIEPGFKCDWFESVAPIAYVKTTQLTPSDVLVTNEILGPNTADNARGIRKVVFNQNCHYTFRNYPIPPPAGLPTPYLDADVIGAMVLSPYCRDALRGAFPRLPLYVTPHGIDGGRFAPSPEGKKKQIAYMPRKHRDEAQQVFGYLHYAGVLDGWEVIEIDGKTEVETAAILGESLVFFAFGYPEGGTLPPFEAMAAGCVVVGYGGFSSDPWIKAGGGTLVGSGNTMEFVKYATPVLKWPQERLVEWGLDSRRLILSILPMSREKEQLRQAWKALGVTPGSLVIP